MGLGVRFDLRFNFWFLYGLGVNEKLWLFFRFKPCWKFNQLLF